MNRIYGFFLAAAIGFNASGEAINLKGKVTNESGKPIPGAIVSLVGSKLALSGVGQRVIDRKNVL